jgi:hypothetical protein
MPVWLRGPVLGIARIRRARPKSVDRFLIVVTPAVVPSLSLGKWTMPSDLSTQVIKIMIEILSKDQRVNV